MESWLLAAAAVLGTIVLAFAVYGVVRWLVHGRIETPTADLASSILFRIGALHGLILALIFAQEQLKYSQLEQTVMQEAAAVADIYYGLGRYGGEEARELQVLTRDYVTSVIERDWPALGERSRLSDEAWIDWIAIFEGVLDLQPKNLRQQDLRAEMLDDLDDITSYRRARQAAAGASLSDLFWIAGIAGFALIVVPYFTYPPRRVNLVLFASFAGYTGLILYFIYALSNPFEEPALLEPVAFEQLLREGIDIHPAGGAS